MKIRGFRLNLPSLLSAVLAVILLCACEHRELHDPSSMHYVRIYLNEHLRNVNFGFYDETKPRPEYKTPNVLRVTLCHSESGKVVSERYLRNKGCDGRGNYIDGYVAAPPGRYNLLAYNFDTQSTHVRNDKDYFGMQVYTNPIREELRSRLSSVRNVAADDSTRVDEWQILYEPDHFFVESKELVTVHDRMYTDTLYTDSGDHFTAESVVKTYYIQVNVKGIEYVKNAVSFITGMAGATQMHDRTMVAEPPSSIYFNMNPGTRKARTGETVAVAYANFNTFGKLRDTDGFIFVTFEFNTTFGTTQVETIRLKEIFDTPQVRDNQWIIIDKTIEIIPPEGSSTGGMNPGVGEWQEIEGNITI